MTVEELQAEVASLKARVKELNDESAGRRIGADKAKTEFEAATAKHAAELAARDEKVAAAERTAVEAGERTTHALRDAALKLAAKDAGIVDLDGLKLLDTSAVKVGDDGTVAIPDKFFEKAKELKPYLFTQTGAQTGNTASTAKPPSAAATAPKQALAMTDAEYAAARSAAISGR